MTSVAARYVWQKSVCVSQIYWLIGYPEASVRGSRAHLFDLFLIVLLVY